MGTTASTQSYHGPPSVASSSQQQQSNSDMTKVKHVKDPYHKHGNRRSCFNPKFLLQQGLPSAPSNHSTSNMTVLMQLTLLQDWQRVLIRARLFGQEGSQPCVVKLFHGKKFRVLPLHVACALDPPPQVIEALLAQTANHHTGKKMSKKQRVLLDDEEQAIEASAVPPLSLSAVPVVSVRSKKKSSKKNKSQHSQHPIRPQRSSWTKALAHTLRPPRDDQEELLQQKGSSSVVDIYCDDDDSLLESRLASNGSVSGAATDLYAYSMEAATLKEASCCISPENSIGDTDGEDDDSIDSTVDGSDSFHTSNEDVLDDDDPVEVVAQESSVLGSFLEQQGVVLQLTTSGNIQPLELPVQQLKQQIGPEEWSTIEPKPSGASSSITHTLSQQSSIFSDDIAGARPSITLDPEQLIAALVEQGSQSQLLAIHVACLYQASAPVLKVLLDAFPEGSMNGIFGMLPIHLIAANWKLPPIPLSSNPTTSSTPSGMPSSLLYSELGLEEENTGSGQTKKERLQVLIESTPESLMAKSVCHDLRPLEYLQFLVDAKKIEGQLKNEEASLFYLEDEEKVRYHRNQKATIKKRSDVSSHKEIDCDRTSSFATNTSTTIASSVAEVTSSSSASSTASFAELLQHGQWEEAMSRLEIDHTLAREWHYGIDKHNATTGEPCTLWKRLPLHIVCAGITVTDQEGSAVLPVGLVQLLIQVYPEALRSVDPHTGMIPLHLACRSCASEEKSTIRSEGESTASVMFQIIYASLRVFPHLTKVVDSFGRLPLHHAVIVGAPFPVVELLVRQDPGTVLSPDQEGVTPLSRAQKIYPADDQVMTLMELSWL